jgi:hypothetical protein
MTLKSCIGLAAWALLAIARLATAQGNLVVNGDFASNANGWTITDTPGGFGYSSVVGNPGGGVLLDNVTPSTLSDPTARQTINGLTTGTTYLLSGDYQPGKLRGSGLPAGPSFGVAINGDFLFTTAAPQDFLWRHFSVFHTASSATAVLSLSSQIDGTGLSYAIDNIALQAVPEPSTRCMGLFCFGMLLCYWRIQRSIQSEPFCINHLSKISPPRSAA